MIGRLDHLLSTAKLTNLKARIDQVLLK